MEKKNWIVYAECPKNWMNTGWDFSDDYFPRKFHYKVDAVKAAQCAKEKGGVNVKVEKEK